jgi:hypothetical protein
MIILFSLFSFFFSFFFFLFFFFFSFLLLLNYISFSSAKKLTSKQSTGTIKLFPLFSTYLTPHSASPFSRTIKISPLLTKADDPLSVLAVKSLIAFAKVGS